MSEENKENLSKQLECLKSLDIGDVKLEDLVDIRTVHIDTSKPVLERILSFMALIKNPYLFKVGDTPVKVEFNDDGPSLQEALEQFILNQLK